jgi:hypothetical protein
MDATPVAVDRAKDVFQWPSPVAPDASWIVNASRDDSSSNSLTRSSLRPR